MTWSATWVTDDYGVIVMASSMGREESQENNKFRGGAFTVALTEGLSGRADTNKDGVVYLNELDAYVTEPCEGADEGPAASGDGEADEHPIVPTGASVTGAPAPQPVGSGANITSIIGP